MHAEMPPPKQNYLDKTEADKYKSGERTEFAGHPNPYLLAAYLPMLNLVEMRVTDPSLLPKFGFGYCLPKSVDQQGTEKLCVDFESVWSSRRGGRRQAERLVLESAGWACVPMGLPMIPGHEAVPSFQRCVAQGTLQGFQVFCDVVE